MLDYKESSVMSEQSIFLGDTDLPEYIKSRVILEHLGQTVEDATQTLVSTSEDGAQKKFPILRVPLIELEFHSQDDLDNAVLRSMGYNPEDRPVSA
jgi:hypothetical protein